jgi:spermidine synthase
MRILALFLTTLTGFTGLVYEVLWQRYLAILLGSHGEATAAVLAMFLGGLACGYALFGEVARRLAGREGAGQGAATSLLLRAYGLVETGIGLYAFAFPWLFEGARRVSLMGPRDFEAGAFALDVLLTALLIGPPTVLMGGTIPLLTQGLARGLADATRFHALVYATNTLGAFFGAVAGAFALLPLLGLATATFSMGVLNVAAGATFLALGRRRDERAATRSVQPDLVRSLPTGVDGAAPASDALGIFAPVALLVGFAMMALQTTFNRLGAMAFGASEFTFATVVAAFVLCMAIGSLAVSGAGRIPASAPVVAAWLLVASLTGLYPFLEDAPYWAHALRSLFGNEAADFHAYYLAVLGVVLAVLLVPLALSGALLPLLFHHLQRRVGDLGAVAGRLYSWNTAGSLLGALLGGYLLLFFFDLHHVYRLAVLALVAGAGLLSREILEKGRGPAGALALAFPVLLVLLPAWSPDRLSSGLIALREPRETTWLGPSRFFAEYFSGPQATSCVFYDDDPCTSVAVLASRTTSGEPDLSIIVNGKSDGSIHDDDLTMRLLALFPAMLADHRERAFVIGFGTGVTAGELLVQGDVEEVVVAEISPGVIAGATHFEEHNGGVLGDPRLRIVRGDAYRALLRSEGTFDLILSEPSNPRVTGVEMLYSEEFLRAARGRLRPGGVYAQWFHTSFMDSTTFALVLNTYRRVFPRASVWFTAKQDVVLLGRTEGGEGDDLERLVRAWEGGAFRPRLERLGIDSLAALFAHELLPAGVLDAVRLDAGVQTLLHPVLNHAAARAYFAGRPAAFPPTFSRAVAETGAAASLLGRYRAQVSEQEWERARPAMVTNGCFRDAATCMVFLAHWRRAEPDSRALRILAAQARDFWGEGIDEALLPAIAALWDAPPTGAAVSYEEAERVRALFATHYSHAFPFAASALHEPWRRCAAAGDRRCLDQLPEVEALGAAR